jgi:type I restriction enzyme S subunit
MRELPDGWEYRRVDQVGDVQLGRQRSPAMMTGPYMRPYLRVANVLDGYIDYSDILEMNFSPHEAQTFGLQPGDILLNEGQALDLVGRCAVFNGPPGMCFQNTLLRFRPRTVLPKFAAAVFKHWLDHGEFRKITRQTTSIAHLGSAQFAAMHFPYVPLQEQHRIVQILDSASANIAATQSWLEKLESVSSALAAARLADLAADAQTVMQLSSVATVLSGVTLGSEPSGSGTVEIPYLRVANVQDGYVDTSEMKTIRILRSDLPKYLLRKGDVLLTEGGDLDKLGRGTMWDARIPECICQNHIFRVRCDESQVLPGYLSLYIGSHMGKAYFLKIAKQTTNLASINSTQLKQMPLPIPNVGDQASLIELMASSHSKLETERQRLTQLQLLKEGLMDDLLTGRVRVTVLYFGEESADGAMPSGRGEGLLEAVVAFFRVLEVSPQTHTNSGFIGSSSLLDRPRQQFAPHRRDVRTQPANAPSIRYTLDQLHASSGVRQFCR